MTSQQPDCFKCLVINSGGQVIKEANLCPFLQTYFLGVHSDQG